MREKIEVSIFEPLEKNSTLGLSVYEIPKVGEIIRVLGETGFKIEYEFQVNKVIHLCAPSGSHIIALHCQRLSI